jgi:hypothetical protein
MKGNMGGDKAKQSIDQAAKLFGQSNFAKQLAIGTASGLLVTPYSDTLNISLEN